MAVTLPVKTGGPVFPPYPSDATKYGLSILGYFAAHAMTGLCANPEVVNQAFIETVLAPSPEPTITQPENVSASQSVTPTALGVLEYTFSSYTTEPPAASHVRLDNADQNLATKLWIDKTTFDGIDAHAALIAVDERYGIYLQDKDDSSCHISYSVTGKAIDKGVYVELPVSFIMSGAPLPEQRVLLSVYKLVAVSELTPELLARIAYTIAAEMVEVSDQIPIEPSPVPSEPTEQQVLVPVPVGPISDSVTVSGVTISGAPAA